MRILARQNHRTTRRANRIRDEGIRKPHPFPREPIQMRRFDELAAIRTDRVRRVIVSHDEDDVRTCGLRTQRNKQEHEPQTL
jgi:hypothetical protein